MAPSIITTLLFMSLLISSCFSSQVYVVYMGNKNSNSPDEVTLQNHQLLSTVHGGSMAKAEESHVYSYSKGFRGFAAKLSEEQASHLAETPGVVSVFPNTKMVLHTTRSWDFMGLAKDENAEIPGSSTKNQENVIIGFIDTGIWPESPSFSDEGMPPVPSRWRGKCQSGESFPDTTCNKKIIGARYYLEGYKAEEQNPVTPTTSIKGVRFKSARDSQGHGSHTASTAAGRYINNVNYGGLAMGAARGGAPMVRIAVYKACWEDGCYGADILAAFDDAIGDGVDILSVSLGSNSPQGDYFLDTISVGSFHAASHGILVVASAGNAGPTGSANNVAPWMLTVGASSTDRNFVSDIVLDGGTKFTGESLHTFQMNSPVPTILAADANAGGFTPDQSSFCIDGSLNQMMVSGKILVCRYSSNYSAEMMGKSVAVKNAGGVGMILIDESEKGKLSSFAIPAVSVGRSVGELLISYLKSTSGAKAIISPTRIVFGSQPAPQLAKFSSRGPNLLTPEIVKPDIMAPGLDILAAWTPADHDQKYAIVSGTSMACPHITGLAALIKAVNPSWSASTIKSAIMTTATVLDKNGKFLTADPGGNPGNPFDFGSGFPDPTKVLNPGLVYDIDPSDYKDFLCSIGYNDSSLRLVTGDGSICLDDQPVSDLNYPSIAVPNLKDTYSVTRTVTNVGSPQEYLAVVAAPAGVNVTVIPDNIVFTSYGEKKTFTVKFTSISTASSDYVFGSLSWYALSGSQVATSSLVVRVATP